MFESQQGHHQKDANEELFYIVQVNFSHSIIDCLLIRATILQCLRNNASLSLNTGVVYRRPAAVGYSHAEQVFWQKFFLSQIAMFSGLHVHVDVTQ